MSKSTPDLPARKPVAREPHDSAEEHPPAYSAGPASPPPNASSSSSERPPAQPSPSSLTPYIDKPTIDFAAYAIRGSSFSKDTSSRTLHHASLCSDPAALEKLLEAQLSLPPIPVIRIRGHRREVEGREDFDLRLNLLPLILRGPHGGRDWHHIKCLEKGELGLRGTGTTEGVTPSIEGGLRAWVHRFCEDRSQHKSFTIRRTITGWDTESLEGQLRTLLASGVGYPGHVQIDFVLTHAALTIHTPKPPGFLDHATSMLFSGKKKEVKQYEPAKSVWPYSIAVHADNGERRRIPAVKSEAEWFAQWRAAIAMGVCERRKGWISAEDQMDLMLVPERGEMKWPGQASSPSQPHG